MGRYKLRSPDQPWYVRWPLGVFEFAASLKLAVSLIFGSGVVLALGTFVESAYGTPAVSFGVYNTWWFTALCALLATNIFSAAAIRFPWKRHQTGFVITHIGLLTMLFGCLWSRLYGIDAQIPIFEGSSGNVAYEDSQRVKLVIHRAGLADGNDGKQLARERGNVAASAGGRAKTIEIPFPAGPFNWSDYDGMLPALPWGLALRARPGHVLYDEDGIKLTALDYYSNSEQVEAPAVDLAITTPRMKQMGADGREMEMPEQTVPVSLSIPRDQLPGSQGPIGTRTTIGGGSMVFMMAIDEREVTAFLQAVPQAPDTATGVQEDGPSALGPKGTVFLSVDGNTIKLPVDSALGQKQLPLGESGWMLEVAAWFEEAVLYRDPASGELRLKDSEGATANDASVGPAVELVLHREGNPPERLMLLADYPEYSRQGRQAGVYGGYYFERPKPAETAGGAPPMGGPGGQRIDILQGPDHRLYYRYWNRHGIAASGTLPADGARVDAFKMPFGQLQMFVKRHVPADSPGLAILPLPFNRSDTPGTTIRAARLRLEIDGKKNEEFWVRGLPYDPSRTGIDPSERHTVGTEDRAVTVSLPQDIIQLGFRVGLDDFQMRLTPGTNKASHFSSIVDFLDRGGASDVLQGNVLITMNAPVDFAEPRTGKSYRFFQESYQGPWLPGEEFFERYVPGSSDRKQLYCSVLTVNYDPGRGIKYTGNLLIVAGIATMFYMRAYFFKRPAKAAPPSATRHR